MSYNSTAGELGPHQFASRAKPSRIALLARKIGIGMKRPKSVSSILFLIAFFSFVANTAFLYFGYDKLSALNILLIEHPSGKGIGSDDSISATAAPYLSIIPQTHYLTYSLFVLPPVSAQAFLVADADTGEILFKQNTDQALPIASVSKLMTAVVTKENDDLEHYATVDTVAHDTFGSEGELALSERILVGDLLYPLLMESSNDAAELLADDYGTSKFISLMNDKAKTLNMYNTFFVDSSGLSDQDSSTASDLLKLSLYIDHSYPDLLNITRVRQYAIYAHTWLNQNTFLDNPDFAGGKNGFIDQSKETTVSFFNVPVQLAEQNASSTPQTRKLVIILLKSNDRDKDMSNILSYVSKNIRYAATSTSQDD